MKLKSLLQQESYSWMKFVDEDDDATSGVSRNPDPANQNPNDPTDSEGDKSLASQKADALGLTPRPYGMYADDSGKIVAKSVKGGQELVRLTPHDDRENPENAPDDSSGASHFKDDDFRQEPSNNVVAGRFDKDAAGEKYKFGQQPATTGYNDADMRKVDKGDAEFNGTPQDAERNNATMFHQSHAQGQPEIPDTVDTKPVDVGTSAKMKEPPGYKVNNDPNVGLHGDDNVDPTIPKMGTKIPINKKTGFPTIGNKSTKLRDMIPTTEPDNLSSASHTYPSTNIDPAIPTENPTQAASHHENLAKGVLSKANFNYDLARRSLYKSLQKHPEKEQQYKKIAAELNKLEQSDTSFINNLAQQIKQDRANKIAKSRERYPAARINPNKDL